MKSAKQRKKQPAQKYGYKNKFLARQKANKPRSYRNPFNYYWRCRNVVLTDSPAFYFIQ